MIYLKIIYFNTFDKFELHLLHVYFMPSCLAWNIPEPKSTRPYLEQNNVSMMSQTSDTLWSWHIPLLLSSRIRTPPGSTVGLLLLLCFISGLAVEGSSCFISVLNLDLYVAVLIRWLVYRSPSREPNNLYVYEAQHNLGRGLLQRETCLSPPVVYYFRFQGVACVVGYSNRICSSVSH